MKTMRAAVKYNDVHRWARNFLNRLESAAAVHGADLALDTDTADLASGETVRTIR
jgi:hypothetical protein